MKKVFSILLTAVMLLNMGIMVMAEETNTSILAQNMISNGGFEETVTGWKEAHLGLTVETGENDSAVLKQDASAAKNGDYGLTFKLKRQQSGSNKYYPAAYLTSKVTLEAGRFYVASAWVRAKMSKFDQIYSDGAWNDNTEEAQAISQNFHVGFIYTNSDMPANSVDVIRPDFGTFLGFATRYGGAIYNSDSTKRYGDLVLKSGAEPETWGDWVFVQDILYVKSENDVAVNLGLTTATPHPVVLNIDDVSLTPVNVMLGNESLVAANEGAAPKTYDYTLQTSSITEGNLAEGNTVWSVNGEGLSIENGTLAVSYGASETAEIKAEIPAFTVGDVTYNDVLTKTVKVHNCIAASNKNLLGIGDFETEGTKIVTSTDGTKITNIDDKIKSGDGSHCYIVGYSDTESNCGNKSLELYHSTGSNSYYPVVFVGSELETASRYKFSAWVKLKEKEAGVTRKANTNVRVRTDEIFTVTDAGLLARWGKYSYTDGLTLVSVNTEEWKLVEAEFVVPKTDGAETKTVNFVLTGALENFYIDDVSLVKTGSVDIVGASSLTAPKEGSITSAYTISGEGIADASELVLKENYTGVTLENGVLTVTPKASGEITIGVKKNVTRSSVTEREFVITKTITIHNCIAASSENILGIGDFETVGTIKTNADGKITDIDGKVTVKNAAKGWIVGYSDDAFCGEKSLELYHNDADNPVVFSAKIDTGSRYKLSAMVKLKELEEGVTTRTADTNMRVWTENVYTVTGKDDTENTITELKKRWKYVYTDSYTKTKLKTDEWIPMEMEFFVPKTDATESITAQFGITTGATRGFLVDDLSLVKVGSVKIEGEDLLMKPETGSITSAYTLTGDGVAEASELVLKENYTGVTFENGVLTVTSEAEAGTIVLGVKKNLAGSETGIFVIEKAIEIHDCVAKSSENILTGGDFETKGEFIHKNPEDPESMVTAIAGTALEMAFTPYSDVVGYSNEAFCGNQSLEINQPTAAKYYPATFKAHLERGSIYKFTAFVKLKESSTQTAATLIVTTDKDRHSPYNGIYILDDGTLNDVHGAGSPWNTGYVEAEHNTKFSKSGWTKFEKLVYVSDDGSMKPVTAWMGLLHMGGDFNYYIDDVSLVKVGEVKLNGANYIDIPVESTQATYTFTSDVTATDAVFALEAETAGVTLENNVLTVTNAAQAGVVTLQVKVSDKVVAEKEIVLFDNTGKVIEKTDDDAGNVSYKAYVKETVAPSMVLVLAKYDENRFESANLTSSTDMGDYTKVEKTATLGNGSYKFMLWQGLDNVKPIAEAEDVVVNITAE